MEGQKLVQHEDFRFVWNACVIIFKAVLKRHCPCKVYIVIAELARNEKKLLKIELILEGKKCGNSKPKLDIVTKKE